MINSIENVCIYDIEVFKENWIVVIYDIKNDTFNIYRSDLNNVKSLREFIVTRNPVLCGFNNKHYDDYILLGILAGNPVEMVKAHNDFIINGGGGWEYEGIKGVYKKDWFRSFDLRDDLPIDLSLKAIEGNLGANITESNIPFDLPRALTAEEIKETTEYCMADVKNTYELFKIRAGYLNGKLKVAKTGNLDPVMALGLTNPKLSATFLKASKLSNPTNGELVYNPPKELRLEKYKEVLDFYKVIDYEKTLTIKAKDLELVYGWGGIHGAIEHCQLETTDTFKIVDIDVGSYYPSMMIQLGYAPSSIPSAKGYEDIYNQRISAKHAGDSDTADALKLVLNSTYGALKNQYNPLYEPRVANHITISGQCLLTDLVEKLEDIPTLKLIQANTDGLMIGYNPKHEKKVNEVVAEWENRTRLNMEYTEIKKIVQKDVNNYVLIAGSTYLIKDGVKTVTKEDKSKIAVKGAYVSLYAGGDFRNNSLVIVHKALVEYFLNGTPVEETINNASNVLDFQMIAKTGRTYTGTVYENAGVLIPVQRVNRVYASLDASRGTLYKLKDDGRKDKIANIPDHCIIDNTGQKVSILDIDKRYYIEVAKKRINDYLGIKEVKEKRGKKSMVAKKAQEPEKVDVKAVSDFNIYEKLALSKLQFGNANIKQTGINRFAGFKYFELADIVPVANAILAENGLVFYVKYNNDFAVGTLVNCNNPSETIEFTSPMRELNTVSNSGKNKMNELQGLGAEQTYQKRYLYYMLFDVVEADVFDATLGKEETNEKPVVVKQPASKETRQEMKQELAENSPVTELQKNSIKNGLTKLREANGDETYIAKVVAKMQSGCTSKEAEEIINEITSKLYPSEG